MNPMLPNSNPDETRTKKKLKASKSKLRVINQGTVYDATGRMRTWIREIESGKYGRCTDIVMIARCHEPGGEEAHVRMWHNGTGKREIANFLCTTGAGRTAPI